MEQQELMELLARSKRVWGSSPSKCEEKSVVENYDFGWLVRPLDNHSPSSSSVTPSMVVAPDSFGWGLDSGPSYADSLLLGFGQPVAFGF